MPHVYGSTRGGTMFGAGYVAAQDRLFFIDVLRHAGRAELSSFVGGAKGNRAMDAEQWSLAPYTEDDFQHQYDLGEQVYGAKGAALKQDAADYVAGINQYISEARLDPSKMPGEYAAIGRPQGPDDWKVTDLFATASLVGGIFGKGGGQELAQVELLRAFTKKFGQKKGRQLWEQFAAFEDKDAPTTVTTGKRFPYQAKPKGKRVAGAEVLPDKGSFKALDTAPSQKDGGSARAASTADDASAAAGILGGPGAFPTAMSNALLLSGAKSATGKPIAVIGPQVGYFAPQILMEEDLHGPGIDARGASFPGVNLYVQLGHGRDYAWSATSAGQDIIDTFAVPLCDATHYRFRGQCLEIENLDRTNSLEPERGRLDAGGQRDAARPAHEARPRRGPRHLQGQAGAVHGAALDLHARGRLGHRLQRLQQPRPHPQRQRLPARRLRDRLHVQLVLHRQPAHRLLQLRQRAGPRQGHDRTAADGLQQGVEGLQPRPQHRQLRARPRSTRRSSTSR